VARVNLRPALSALLSTLGARTIVCLIDDQLRGLHGIAMPPIGDCAAKRVTSTQGELYTDKDAEGKKPRSPKMSGLIMER